VGYKSVNQPASVLVDQFEGALDGARNVEPRLDQMALSVWLTSKGLSDANHD
jgi:hypothetical protein